jgi:hypothetical protein
MRRALPAIGEDAETLKRCLQRTPDGRQKARLQRRSLLASGQGHTRQDMARLLGVQCHTIGHWLAIYALGGLDALLALDVLAGKPLSLPPDVLAALEQALRQPAGCASYDALRQWVQQTSPLAVNDHTL